MYTILKCDRFFKFIFQREREREREREEWEGEKGREI